MNTFTINLGQKLDIYFHRQAGFGYLDLLRIDAPQFKSFRVLKRRFIGVATVYLTVRYSPLYKQDEIWLITDNGDNTAIFRRLRGCTKKVVLALAKSTDNKFCEGSGAFEAVAVEVHFWKQLDSLMKGQCALFSMFSLKDEKIGFEV